MQLDRLEQSLLVRKESAPIAGLLTDPPVSAAIIVAIVALIWSAARLAIVDAPIYASDEYAYFSAAQFFPEVSLAAQFDPKLQQTGNSLYQAWASRFFLFGPERALRIAQAWHFLAYLATAAIAAVVVRSSLNVRAAIFTFAATLALPMSSYTASFLPEVDFMLAANAVAAFQILAWRRRPISTSFVTGALVGAAFLIKPHGVALLAGCLLFIFLDFLRPKRFGRATVALSGTIVVLTFIATVYAIKLVINTAPNAHGTSSFVGDFYQKYLQSGTSAGFWLHNAKTISIYFFAHLTLLALLFPAAIAIAAMSIRQASRDRLPLAWQSTESERPLFAFVACNIVAFVAMISVFSTHAGNESAFEAMRLHGRYLLWTFPLLLSVTFQVVIDRSAIVSRRANLVLFVASALTLVWILPNFKIFPWDYPEAFAIRSNQNSGGWNWSLSTFDFGRAGLISCLAVASLGLFWKRFIHIGILSSLCVVIALGNVMHFAWIQSHLAETRGVVDAARTARGILRNNSPGDGVVVGQDRYGSVSFALMGLANAPHVIAPPVNGSVTNEELPLNSKWLLAVDPLNAKFRYTYRIGLGNLTLFLLPGSPVNVAKFPLSPWDDQPIHIAFGERRFQSSLFGFNEQEPWGAWTSSDHAEVQLPVMVSGDIKLRISGWTLPESLASPLEVSIGGRSAVVSLDEQRRDTWIELRRVSPSDTLAFSMQTVRPPGSGRAMGAAIVDVELVRSE